MSFFLMIMLTGIQELLFSMTILRIVVFLDIKVALLMFMIALVQNMGSKIVCGIQNAKHQVGK